MKILIIAYYFPPDSSSGSFRPLFFANHLTVIGDQIHVLTALDAEFSKEQRKDYKLIDQLNHNVVITRCSVKHPREVFLSVANRFRPNRGQTAALSGKPISAAVKAKTSSSFWQSCKDVTTDILATPDPQIGWVPDCVRQGKKICASWCPDIIWATGSPWSSFLAGVFLKKAVNVPLVLDFRDPWVSNPNFIRRNRMIRSLDTRLERYAVNSADGIIANTEVLREDFLSRYHDLDPDRIVSITNGFEKYQPIITENNNSKLTITHVGELYFSRDPEPLIAAVKILLGRKVVNVDDIQLNFIGGIEIKGDTLKALLAENDIQRIINITPRLPYNDAQLYAQLSDVLLIVQPSFPLQIPRKLYEYISLQKPIFCIAEQGSATSRLVSEKGLGVVADNTIAELVLALEKLVYFWRQGALVQNRNSTCAEFTNHVLSQKLHNFLSGMHGCCI